MKKFKVGQYIWQNKPYGEYDYDFNDRIRIHKVKRVTKAAVDFKMSSGKNGWDNMETMQECFIPLTTKKVKKLIKLFYT